jgi:hypothetical protein
MGMGALEVRCIVHASQLVLVPRFVNVQAEHLQLGL